MAQAEDPGKRARPAPAGGRGGADRKDRLKAALKANMARRKAQGRARAAQNDNKGPKGRDEESS